MKSLVANLTAGRFREAIRIPAEGAASQTSEFWSVGERWSAQSQLDRAHAQQLVAAGYRLEAVAQAGMPALCADKKRDLRGDWSSHGGFQLREVRHVSRELLTISQLHGTVRPLRVQEIKDGGSSIPKREFFNIKGFLGA